MFKTKYYRWYALVLIVLALIITSYVLVANRNEMIAVHKEKLSLNTIKPLPELKVGDVILRMGVGVDSVVIAKLSNSKFSHVGIISQVHPEIMVTHATTADDATSAFDGVIKIKLANFVSQSERLAIVRYEQLPKASQEQIQAYLASQEGKPFILSTDSNALYCSNLVLAALKDHVKLKIEPQQVQLALFQGPYIMPQAFLDDPNASLIYYYPQH